MKVKNYLPTAAEARAYLSAGKKGKRPLTAYERQVFAHLAKGGKLKRARKNPECEETAEEGTVIYDQIGGIWARKGQPHSCDPECAASDHWYEHTFTEKFPVIGLPDGTLQI